MLKTLNTTGVFYQTLLNQNGYDCKMQECISETVKNLIDKTTTTDRPGMLLGKIQSGKTRTFLGVTALSFDNGFDVAIVLTKGTRALAQQTLERLKQEFRGLIDADKVQIFDIMALPNNLTRYELDQKLIFVVKKEIKNMTRLHDAFFETYPHLSQKRVLIIDDEADFASIGFVKSKTEGVEIKKIAGKIDEFRKNVKKSGFLQVTATPYSLYLQPEDVTIDEKNLVFKPIKPTFTVLVPVHEKYIGGEYYFSESEDESSAAYYLHEEVQEDELVTLKKQDRRSFKIEECLTSRKVKSLRNAIVNFLVGGCIRRLQAREQGQVEKKYSFIIHTEQNKAAHAWQESIIMAIKERLTEECKKDSHIFFELIQGAYDNLKKSINLYRSPLPTLEEVTEECRRSLNNDYMMITIVNSEKDVNELLDETGQLKLRPPLNIFIGGQILDRGITIGNLIGFYYGRRPKTFQQDTVLQHCRMYGARPIEDLTVTRFYTTADIYSVMKRIHEFDTALREAFENGSYEKGVIFIQKDSKNQIIPCSPNKILLSGVTTLRPSTRLLPVGFEVKAKTSIEKLVKKIDRILENYSKDFSTPFLVSIKDAVEIIKLINETFKDGHNWDLRAFIASLEYLSTQSTNSKEQGKVWVIVRTGRESQRQKKDGRFENSPDSYQEKGEARKIAVDIPALILLRQNGDVEKGWSGHPFWWPVMVAPSNTKTVVFTSEQANLEFENSSSNEEN
jgi:Z1 domain